MCTQNIEQTEPMHQEVLAFVGLWPKLCEGCRMIALLESNFREVFVCHRCQLVDHLQREIIADRLHSSELE